MLSWNFAEIIFLLKGQTEVFDTIFKILMSDLEIFFGKVFKLYLLVYYYV